MHINIKHIKAKIQKLNLGTKTLTELRKMPDDQNK